MRLNITPVYIHFCRKFPFLTYETDLHEYDKSRLQAKVRENNSSLTGTCAINTSRRIDFDRPSWKWGEKRSTSDIRRLSSRMWPVRVLNSYFGTCAGCSNLMCNETITSQLVIDSHSDQFLECIQMKVCSWHIFDRQKSLNEKKGDWAAIKYLLISCTRIRDLRKKISGSD